MPIPFLDLQTQYQSLKTEIDAAMHKVLDTSSYVSGPDIAELEKAFAEYCEAPFCVGVNSGTAALALLMQAHGIGAGDEVITVANSFFASAEAISEIGAIPVLVDCREDDGLMDSTKLEAAITPRTKAILPVHLYGQCADMDAINAIAKRHALLVFEDACQAHGALYQGKKAGALADGAAFSFYPGKNLGAYGDAGAITANSASVTETLKMLRDHGSKEKYVHEIVGWNERIDTIQAAVLKVKLPHLDSWNTRRRAIAALYRSRIGETFTCMKEQSYGSPVYHLFVIRTDRRAELQAFLKDRGIATGIHYPTPIHLQPAYQGKWQEGDFPISEKLAHEILSLPMYPDMTDDQVAEVCDALLAFA